LASNIVTAITSSNFIELGCDHPGGDEYGTDKMNDFRIYDHCLSPKEVKEISQGLVLHYKMDNINAEGTNLITGLTAGGQTTISNGIVTTSGVNADTYFTLNLSENIVAGTTYTISCYASGLPDGVA
jgi:hypothetical protein